MRTFAQKPKAPHHTKSTTYAGQSGQVNSILHLQRAIGNQAMARLLQSDDGGQTTIPPVVQEALRSPGRPLDSTTRAFMEPRFGYDFSGVRVHADTRADAAAAAIGARAFTVGDDVVIRQGELAPHTEVGRALLAHELAHTVQQRTPRDGSSSLYSGEAAERSADQAAEAALAGGPVSSLVSTGVCIARQPDTGSQPSEPSLKEQGDTLLRLYSRLIAAADREGYAGITFTTLNKGKALAPMHMEKLGPQESRPAGTRPLSERAAADMLRNIMDQIVQYPGEFKVDFARDESGVMKLHSWALLTESPTSQAAPSSAPVKSVSGAEQCDVSDVNYGECIKKEREGAYKQGIQAAGVVAEAFLDPTAGPPGGPGVLAKVPGKLDRLSKIKQAAGRIKRHSGYNVPYRIIGPHDKLKGTSVYILKDAEGTILYVGKGNTLDRLREHIKDPKKTQWFGEIAEVEVKATGLNNTQALALEEDLIGALKPLHNVDMNPFRKEFGDTLSLAANLPKAQEPLKFLLEWGH